MRRCVAEEIGRRLRAREVAETPEFIRLDEFAVSGRRLYHTAICNLVKGEVMEVVEGQGQKKVEEAKDESYSRAGILYSRELRGLLTGKRQG